MAVVPREMREEMFKDEMLIFKRQVLIPLNDERSKIPASSPVNTISLNGEIGDSIRGFVRAMSLKQTTQNLISLLQLCGESLISMGEVKCAKEYFFARAMEASQGCKEERMNNKHALEDVCWKLGIETQTSIAIAKCNVSTCLSADSRVKFPRTVASLTSAMKLIQASMTNILHTLPVNRHEGVAWLLLNGCIEIYRIAEPLVSLGHAKQTIEFLTWCALTMEAVVTLSASRHLHWRMRIYASIAHAYEDLDKLKGARNCVYHAKAQVTELRRLEELDPPLPPKVENHLRRAEWDLTILMFKYDHALELSKPLPSPEYEAVALTRAKTKPQVASLEPEVELAPMVPVEKPPSSASKKKPSSSKGGKPAPPPVVESPPDDLESLGAASVVTELSILAAEDTARVFKARATGSAIVRFMSCEASLNMKSRQQRWRALCEALATANSPHSRPLREGFEGSQSLSGITDENIRDVHEKSVARRRSLSNAALWMILPLSVRAQQAEAAAEEQRSLGSASPQKDMTEPPETPKDEKKKEKGKKGKDKEGTSEQKSKAKGVELPELPQGSDAIRGPIQASPPELLALLLSLIQIGDFVDANLLMMCIHTWLENSNQTQLTEDDAEEGFVFPGAGERSLVSLTFSFEDPELERKEKQFFYNQLAFLAATLRFVTWEHSEDKVTLEGLIADCQSPIRQGGVEDDDSATAAEYDWILFDESPHLIRIGPPGEVKFLPSNYTLSLISLFESITIFGSGDDCQGAAFLPAPSSDLALYSHNRDMMGDVALLLWRTVCVPLLKQLDSSDAVDFLNPSYNPSSNTATHSPLEMEEIADPLDVPLLVKSLLAVKAGLNTGKVDDPVLSATVSLRLATILGESSLGGGDLRKAVQVCRTALKDIEQARGELVSPVLNMPSHPLDLRALSVASLTCEVSDDTAHAATTRPSAARSQEEENCLHDPVTGQRTQCVFGAGSYLDPLNQALAALHVDLLVMCYRLEYLLAEAQARNTTSRPAPSHHHKFHSAKSKKRDKHGSVASSDAGGGFSPRSTNLGHGLAGLLPPTMETIPDPLFAEPKVPSAVEAANQRSSLEARKNLVAKALLLIETASSLARTSTPTGASPSSMLLGGALGACAPPVEESPHVHSPLGKAVAEILKEAFHCLESSEAKEAELALELTCFEDWLGNFDDFEPANSDTKEKFRSASPPAPSIVSRSDGSITMQPRRWFPLGTAEVSHYRVFGKPAGSGTMVSTQNGDLRGCDEILRYRPETGTAPCVAIVDLCPNEAYVFAVAAYNREGELLGKIGATSLSPIETLNPLPIPLCWSYLARISLGLGQEEIARDAGLNVVMRMCTEKHKSWAMPHPLGRNSGPLTGHIPASLLLKPSVLDRAPRSSLLALAQSLLTVVEVSKRFEPCLEADGNPESGCLAEPPTASSEGTIAGVVSSEGQRPVVGIVTLSGSSSASAQQQTLVQLHRLGLVVELGVMLEDFTLVQRCCHQAFNHCLRPLLSLASRSDMFGAPLSSGPGAYQTSPSPANTGVWRHLFHPLARLHQAMSTIPAATKTRSDDMLSALLTISLTEAGLAAGEAKALRQALTSTAAVLPEAVVDDHMSSASSVVGSVAGSVNGSAMTSAQPSAATSAAPSRASTAGKSKKDGKKGKLEKEDSVEVGTLNEVPIPVAPTPLLSPIYTGRQRSPGTETAQLALYESLLSHTAIGQSLPIEEILRIAGVSGCEVCPLQVEEMLGGESLQNAEASPARSITDSVESGRSEPKQPDKLSPSDGVIANLVVHTARNDLDSAWGLLQHLSLRTIPSRTRLCCMLMSAALTRSPGGGGGRIISLWMKHTKINQLTDLEPLTLKTIHFECNQDHRAWLMCRHGVQGERALVPPYIEITEGEDEVSQGGPHLKFSIQSRTHSEASHSYGSARDSEGGRSEEDGMDDKVSGEVVMEQLKGKPRDHSRTPYDAFCEIVTPPQPVERKQLLWLGQLEVMLALAQVDMFMNHHLAKSKLRSIANFGTFVADGPYTDLRLFLDKVTISSPPPAPFEIQPPSPRKPQLEIPADFVKNEDLTEEESEAELAKHQAAVKAAEDERRSIQAEIERGATMLFHPRYDASRGDVVGPLRDTVDHFCSAMLRFRNGHAWRSLLATAAELWNVCGAVWLSPFAYEPGSLEKAFPDEMANAELGECGTLPPTPWELMAHTVLDLLELRAVLPESPVQDDESDDGDELFRDDEDDEEPSNLAQSQEMDEASEAGFGDPEGKHSSKLKVDLDFCSRFVCFGMSCLLMGRQWASVVSLGRRLNMLTMNLPIAGDSAHALMLRAQAAIVLAAQIEASRCEGAWAEHMVKVDTMTAAHAKRKKRSRMNRGPPVKSPEEVELDQQGAPLKVMLSNARAKLQVAEYAQRWYINTEVTYRKTKTTSFTALCACRDLLAAASHCSPNEPTKALQIYSNAAAIYGRASKLLRDKREQALLQQALNELGDVQLFGLQGTSDHGARFSLTSPFAKSWLESLNALLFSIDAHIHWEKIYRDIITTECGAAKAKTIDMQHSFMLPTALIRKTGLLSCLVGANTIAKLACYASRDDRQKRLELILMSLPLWRAPFSLSIAHPARVIDYALYTPSTPSIFSGTNPFSNSIRLSVDQTMFCLEHSIRTLLEQKEGVLALPLCCFLESLARDVCSNIRVILRARLLRMEALTLAGLIPEAVSVLASLLQGAHLPRIAGGYCGVTFENKSSDHILYPPEPSKRSVAPYPPSAESDMVEGGEEDHVGDDGSAPFSVAELVEGCPLPVTPGGDNEPTRDPFTRNGLCFYGLPPFLSHDNPGSDGNREALNWLIQDSGGDALDSTSVTSKSKNSVSSSKSKKKVVSSEEDQLLALVNCDPPRGAHDVPLWLREQFGLAGLRSLALARGHLLLAMTAGRGLGEGVPGIDAIAIARCRSAADAIARDTAEQCLQRSLIAYQKGLNPDMPRLYAESAKKAILEPNKKRTAPQTDPTTDEDAWTQIESMEMESCHLRCFVNAMTLRSSVAFEDAKFDESQKYALIAVNAVERQMVLMKESIVENGGQKRKEAPSAPEPPVYRVVEVEAPTPPVVEEVEHTEPKNAKGKAKQKGKPPKKAPEITISPEEQASIDAARELKELEVKAYNVEQDAEYAARQVAHRLWLEQLDDADWSKFEEEDEGGSLVSVEKWLALRELLAKAALGQGRNDDCLMFVLNGIKEAATCNEVRCSRRLKLVGARALARMGNLSDAEKQSADLLKSMSSDQVHGGVIDFAKASSFAANLLRERAIGSTSSGVAHALLAQSLALVDAAIMLVAKQARSNGFLGISALTFRDEESDLFDNNVMLADLNPPLLTELLDGYTRAEAIGKGVEVMNKLDLPGAALHVADITNVTVSTPFANIYFEELPVLVALMSIRVGLVLEMGSPKDFAITLRVANEALSLLRYCALPLPQVRARLLLAVGKLRRRTLKLTEEELNFEPQVDEVPQKEVVQPVDVPVLPVPSESKPSKDKGKGKKSASAEPVVVETKKTNTKSSETLSTLLQEDFICGLPRSHPLGSCIAALLGSLSVCFDHCGHEHVHILDCCLEVALLLGGGPVPALQKLHLTCAMRFVELAAQLRIQRKSLTEVLPVSLTADALPCKDLPPALLSELSAFSSEKPTVRIALELLLGLEREEAADPGSLIETHSRLLLASLHKALEAGCKQYKDNCCLDQSQLVEVLQHNECLHGDDFLCIQWRVSDKESANQGDGGLKPFVDAMVLISQCSQVARFSDSSHLGILEPISVQKMKGLHNRAALFRHALQLTLEKDSSVKLPQLVTDNWNRLLCDVYLVVSPNTPNEWVKYGQLKLSNGEDILIPCDVDHLRYIENLLDCDLGILQPSTPSLSAWIRDALCPNSVDEEV